MSAENINSNTETMFNQDKRVNIIKQLFKENHEINQNYQLLMADYLNTLETLNKNYAMELDLPQMTQDLPQLVKSITEKDLGGIYGATRDGRIEINQRLSPSNKKLYFFHELTHALQTFSADTEEKMGECGFYDGHTGMFFTEAVAQYTAQILTSISNETNLTSHPQLNCVRGASERVPYSPLSEYQYNGDILDLLAKTMNIPLPKILGLAYQPDGRDQLRTIYDQTAGEGQFNDLMFDLEKIYSIDYLIIMGKGDFLHGKQRKITMQDGQNTFYADKSIYHATMDKVEQTLVANLISSQSDNYIKQHADEIYSLLTTDELKNEFARIIKELFPDFELESTAINYQTSPTSSRAQEKSTQTKLHRASYLGSIDVPKLGRFDFSFDPKQRAIIAHDVDGQNYPITKREFDKQGKEQFVFKPEALELFSRDALNEIANKFITQLDKLDGRVN